MIIFRNLKELFKIVIQWENRLTEYYNTAEEVVQHEKCKKILSLLREQHLKNLEIIKDIRVEDYGKDEWIRNAPDVNMDVILSTKEITGDSTTEEIASHILEFEEKMRGLYAAISVEIITRDEKELFDSLVKFKDRQIYEIKSCMEVW